MSSVPGNQTVPLKRLIALSALVTVGFAVVCYVVLGAMWARDKNLVEINTSNIVTSVGSEIERIVEMYDLSLQAAAEYMAVPEVAHATPQLRQMILFDRSASAPGLGTIKVLDKNGDVISESRTATHRQNYADRDYFTVHKYNKYSGRYITAPYTTGRGEAVIAITRRIEDANGDFAGVVVGTMKISYLQAMFDKIHRKAGDSLTLVRSNGIVIVRAPFETRSLWKNVSASKIFQRQTIKENGIFEAVSLIDGERRIYAFNHLGDLPLILSYGTSLEVMFSEWREQAWIIGGIFFSLCAINLALVVFLARALRRRIMAEKSLEKIATTDALTGLANRRRFDQVIELEWNRARRAEAPVSLLMIDADHFKRFNDTHGHQAGDSALAAIADCIAHAARRAGECSARYGGEEFAIILPDTTPKGASEVAARILACVGELRAQQQGRDDCTPTVSIGIATLVPQAGLSTRDLIKAADAALYQAKQDGRARYVASPSQLALIAKRMAA